MFSLWITTRFLKSSPHLLSLPTFLGILGMTIGVGSLVMVMSVVSGFQTTLKKSIIDVSGHIILMKGGQEINAKDRVFERIKEHTDQVVAATPFVLVAEAILAFRKKIAGVIIEGADPKKMLRVLNLKSHLIRGRFDVGTKQGVPNALVGKGLAKKFELQIGDVFQVVVPIPSSETTNAVGFKPRLQTLRVTGVLDLGRYDYDERFILTSLQVAQNLSGIGNQVMGYRIKVKDETKVERTADIIIGVLGSSFRIKTWTDFHRNLFEAVKIERIVIFIVIFTMVLAACFNIASVLFVAVLRRYSDISVLRTIGATSGKILRVFVLQGMVIGALGSTFGILFGMALSYGFIWLQKHFDIVPGDIYKLDFIQADIRPIDLMVIVLTSMIVCCLASFFPARAGAKLDAVEGLRYE